MTTKKKPEGYSKWCGQKGEESWWEAPILVELDHYDRVIKEGAEQMAKALTYALFESGSNLEAPKVKKWKDLIRHCYVVNSDVRTTHECLPEQYLFMAYHNWEREYIARKNWEQKSLWNYISYWLRRKFGNKEKTRR